MATNWYVLGFLPHATAALQVLRSMAAVLEMATFTPYLLPQCGVNFCILVSRRVLAPAPKGAGIRYQNTSQVQMDACKPVKWLLKKEKAD